MTVENWLPVPDFETHYEVSDLGHVRSLPRINCKGRVLKPQPAKKKGYLQVGLSVDGKVTTAYVHRLVAAAFIGPCPEGEEVRHGDGNPANNMLTNLSYSTHLVNMGDRVEHGTLPVGELQGGAILTDAQAALIRERWSRGEHVTDLAVAFSATKPTISRVISGEAYPDPTWVPPQEVCHYPGCEELVERRSLKGAKNGRPGQYCDNPEHTRLSAKIQRRRLADQQLMQARPAAPCPYCTKMFVPKRSDQRYCSRVCMKTAANVRIRQGQSST